MKKAKLAFAFNIAIIIMVIIATIIMMAGLQILGHSKTLTEEGFYALQFFTVDSNLLAGISSVIIIVYYLLIMKNKINEIPKWVSILRLCSVVGVSVTMMTTVFYLGFIAPDGYFSMFYNANLFYHLLVPLFCIISFVLFEEELLLPKKVCYYGLFPTAIYSIYYMYNVFSHYDHGVSFHYDFYGFAQGGVVGMIISFLFMLGLTLLISFLLLLFKNLRRKDV